MTRTSIQPPPFQAHPFITGALLTRQRQFLAALFALIALASLHTQSAAAQDMKLLINPIISEEAAKRSYTAMAEYLSAKTGLKITLETSPNYPAAFQRLRGAEEFALVMEASHITGFLLKKKGYEPLAKVTDVVSFSLVTTQDNLVLDSSELIGKRVATLPSPSLGAIFMDEIFPNMLRQPIPVEAQDAQNAVQLLLDGKADAAMIPTPLVSAYDNLATIETTRQVPHVAISASKELSEEVKKTIRQALLEATQSQRGRAMLEKSNNPGGFEAADASLYSEQANMLANVYGAN